MINQHWNIHNHFAHFLLGLYWITNHPAISDRNSEYFAIAEHQEIDPVVIGPLVISFLAVGPIGPVALWPCGPMELLKLSEVMVEGKLLALGTYSLKALVLPKLS